MGWIAQICSDYHRYQPQGTVSRLYRNYLPLALEHPCVSFTEVARRFVKHSVIGACAAQIWKAPSQNSKKVLVMISITFLFFFVELVVGFMNRSIALLADSYHMLSDVMALVIAFVCLRISRRKSKRNGFGWVRAEVLGALVNGVFLLAMCFTISIESIGRLIHSRRISHPLQVLVVGCIGLLINIVGIGMFHSGHGHSHGGGGHSHGEKAGKQKEQKDACAEGTEKMLYAPNDDDYEELDSDSNAAPVNRPVRSRSRVGQECSHNLSLIVGGGSKQHLALKLVDLDENAEVEEFTDSEVARRKQKQANAQNLNMRGVFLHILSDAIGSVFVIVTASLALFFPNALGSLNDYLDPALSLTLVMLICFSAYALVKETAGIILRRTPSFVDLDDIKADILKVLHLNQVMFCTPASFDAAAPKIRKVFHKYEIHSLTMQPIFSSNACSNTNPLSTSLDVIKEGTSEEGVISQG
ncbi:unnamed protein product [Nippostrongylus brasiliensis]|uniref:Cation diffusion facilitator family protein 1 (inferred by orthology to a C. elegans protein) n=1 Tax=Nippostrongylus brasiliensis TaxID=27835 RepID=A0A0N4YHN8_NIPBR|nr:unnamed protein product [Nippostrongylus brasiliensis]